MTLIAEQSEIDLDALNATFESVEPMKIVHWTAAQFGGVDHVVVSSSFGADSAIMLHMATRVMYVKPNCPYCEEARQEMRSQGLKFEERDATTREDWRAVIDGLFLSLLECCHRAVPQMLAKGGGAIVSFASDAAKVATPGESVNGGALAANVMFCRTAGLELARHNIRVNAVTPSITRGTKTYDKVMASPFSKKLFEKAETRARLGVAYAENVAPMAVFLASPLASHITGQVVSVNGGISAA